MFHFFFFFFFFFLGGGGCLRKWFSVWKNELAERWFRNMLTSLFNKCWYEKWRWISSGKTCITSNNSRYHTYNKPQWYIYSKMRGMSDTWFMLVKNFYVFFIHMEGKKVKSNFLYWNKLWPMIWCWIGRHKRIETD